MRDSLSAQIARFAREAKILHEMPMVAMLSASVPIVGTQLFDVMLLASGLPEENDEIPELFDESNWSFLATMVSHPGTYADKYTAVRDRLGAALGALRERARTWYKVFGLAVRFVLEWHVNAASATATYGVVFNAQTRRIEPDAANGSRDTAAECLAAVSGVRAAQAYSEYFLGCFGEHFDEDEDPEEFMSALVADL